MNDHGFIGILAARQSLLSGFPAKCPFHWWLSGAKLMYIYHTLDALVMITPFQSITLQRESDFSCTLVEFWKRFDQIWKIPIGTGKWHVFATFQTARLTLESVHSLLGILPSRHSLVLSTPEISTSGVKFPTLFPTYLFRSPLKSF